MAHTPEGRCHCGKTDRHYKWLRLLGPVYVIYKFTRDLMDR
ncbi:MULTISPECIES: hypothetical protein [unclassified Streptomyces]